MIKWQISEFSKHTGVSVRTLHHYDTIGLLRASERQANGFRIYNKKDYDSLQQILALKFLGFSLSTIKNLLGDKLSVTETFTSRKDVLFEKIKDAKFASKALENIETVIGKIPLKNLLRIVLAYHTLHQVENRSISDSLNRRARTLYYRLTMILQNIQSQPIEDFFTSIEKISTEIESLAMRNSQE
jgi:DNA-binding transcriptional MerR regulator